MITVRADPRPLAGALVRTALFPGAALAVHQLRFVLAFGGGAPVALARQGHSYLHSVVPWIVLTLAVAVGGFLRALGRALKGQTSVPRFTLSLVALWALCTACLVAIYAGQELLEGLFAGGHAVGLTGVFGYGGWWAIPAAACVGLVVAAVLHGARWVLHEVAVRRRPSPRRPGTRSRTRRRRADASLPRLLPVAAGWSGRGPPS